MQKLACVQKWLGHTSHFQMALNTKLVIQILLSWRMCQHHKCTVTQNSCVCSDVFVVELVLQKSWRTIRTHVAGPRCV
jgi:uncharacterized membrane protein